MSSVAARAWAKAGPAKSGRPSRETTALTCAGERAAAISAAAAPHNGIRRRNRPPPAPRCCAGPTPEAPFGGPAAEWRPLGTGARALHRQGASWAAGEPGSGHHGQPPPEAGGRRPRSAPRACPGSWDHRWLPQSGAAAGNLYDCARQQYLCQRYACGSYQLLALSRHGC